MRWGPLVHDSPDTSAGSRPPEILAVGRRVTRLTPCRPDDLRPAKDPLERSALCLESASVVRGSLDRTVEEAPGGGELA